MPTSLKVRGRLVPKMVSSLREPEIALHSGLLFGENMNSRSHGSSRINQ
jgi:hypothetical protein